MPELRHDLATPGAAVIEVQGLRRHYGAGRRRHSDGYEAVRGVDLTVRRGECYALLGTNGAGKTSTLEVIEGLARPSGGAVRVLGLDPYADRAAVRPRIGIMLQDAGFPGALTVRELTAIWGRTLPAPRPADQVLDRVGLGHRRSVSISSLSGGERRRLDLALALLADPEVLFLDEPTTGLDPQSRRTTWELIAELLADGVTVVLTTHYLEEAERLADRIAIMHAGQVAREGTLTEIVARQPTRIRCTVGVDTDLSRIRASLGAACRVSRDEHGRHLFVETFEPQPLLAELLEWAGESVSLAGLHVVPGSLEQAFLEVATESRREPGQTMTEEVAA